MAKAKAKPAKAKPVAKDGLSFEDADITFCCGLTEIGNFEVNKGYYLDIEGNEYATRKAAEVSSIQLAKDNAEYYNESWTSRHKQDAIDDVDVNDVNDCSDDVPSDATFATTNTANQKDVEAMLPKLGFKVVAAWKNGVKETIKLWFKKPDGQKTIRIS